MASSTTVTLPPHLPLNTLPKHPYPLCILYCLHVQPAVWYEVEWTAQNGSAQVSCDSLLRHLFKQGAPVHVYSALFAWNGRAWTTVLSGSDRLTPFIPSGYSSHLIVMLSTVPTVPVSAANSALPLLGQSDDESMLAVPYWTQPVIKQLLRAALHPVPSSSAPTLIVELRSRESQKLCKHFPSKLRSDRAIPLHLLSFNDGLHYLLTDQQGRGVLEPNVGYTVQLQRPELPNSIDIDEKATTIDSDVANEGPRFFSFLNYVTSFRDDAATDSRPPLTAPVSAEVFRKALDWIETTFGSVIATQLKNALQPFSGEQRVTAVAKPRYLVDSPHGILLYGPPGTGKSWLAGELAAQLGLDVLFSGTASDLGSKYVGETEKQLRALAYKAFIHPHRVFAFIVDEVHTIAESQKGGARGRSDRADYKQDSLTVILGQHLALSFPVLFVLVY